MTRSLLRTVPVLAFAIPSFASLAIAQTTSATPASCLRAVTTYEREQLNARATTGMTYAQITAGKSATARTCLGTIAVASTAEAELPDLARLYTVAADTTTAVATIQRYLALPIGTESQRAERYTTAIPVLLGMRTDMALARAEALATGLDSLSSAVNVSKVAGHGVLLGYYRAYDVDDQMDRHATRIIALAPSLDSARRIGLARPIILAYTALAEVYGDRAQAPRAIELLTRGERDLADLPDAAARLAEVRTRYALVGTAAAPIIAPHWFNVPANTTQYMPTGRVTMIQFAAHWCGPCRKSYPAIARLQNKYGPQGMTTVFVTSLYGFFKDRQHLTPEQELDADRKYFLEEHELPVQLAVTPAQEADAGQPGAPDANAAAYRVSGIPQMVLIDREGKIRMIVVGWDPASEARLAAVIETLLGAPAKPAD